MKFMLRFRFPSREWFLPFMVFCISFSGFSATYYTRQNGNWNDPNTWSTAACGGAAAASYPGAVAGDVVNICNGHAVTVTATVPNNIVSITIAATNANTSVTFSGAFTLNVTGAISYTGPTTNGFSNTIAVGAGTLTCASVSMADPGNNARDSYLTLSTGTITCSGNLTMNGNPNRNHVDFSGSGLVRVGGSMTGGGLTASTGTMEFTSAGASNFDNYSFNNLKISGAGTKSLNGNTTVGGNLDVSAGTLSCGGQDFTVTGTSSIAGTFTIAGGNLTMTGNVTISGTMNNTTFAGVNTFSGDISVTATGTWNNSGNDDFTIAGGITNDGTFSGNIGIYTFTGAGKSFNGTSPISFGNAVINGSYTNNLSSPAYLATIDVGGLGDLSGSGSLTQAANAELRIGDDATITTLTATANPNTVMYNGSINQNVRATTYHHLTINKSANTANVAGGAAGTVTVNGTLSILGGALQLNDPADVVTVNAGGNTIISGATSYLNFSAAGTANVRDITLTNGGTINNGLANGNVNATSLTVNETGGTIGRCVMTVSGSTTVNAPLTFNNNAGVKTFQGGVTVNAGGSWTSTTVTTVGNMVFQNGIVSNGTSFSAGGATFNTASQTISGATAVSFAGDVSITGAITVTNQVTSSVTIGGNLTGTVGGSTWKNDPSTTLNYGGAAAPMAIGAFDVSSSGNLVNYNRGGGQTVKAPVSSYYHVSFTNSGTKTLSANTTVAGNLSIAGTAVLNVSGANYNITLAGNWNNSSTNADPFTEANGTVTFNGTALQTITNTGDAQGTEFNNLTVNNTTPAEAIRLNDAVTVNGTLTLTDGHITTTAADILTIGPSGTVTPNGTPHDSSFVKGPMNHTVNVSVGVTKIYPIGKGNNYRRLELTIDQSVATSTRYTAELIPSSARALGYTVPGSLTYVSDIRYFEVSQSAATGLDGFQVRAYFKCTELDDVVENLPDLKLAQDDGASGWRDIGGTAAGGDDPDCAGLSLSGEVLSSMITNPPFGFILHAGVNRFALASSGGINPLPVELLSFSAEKKGNTVDVKWVTASEQNSDHFVVQRSKDGTSFEDVSQTPAAGNSNTVKNYSSTDYEPLQGVSFYRLKEVDKDGKTFYSNPVSVDFNSSEDGILVYPNPSDGKFTVQLAGQTGTQVLVVLRDVQGKEFYSKVFLLTTGSETLAIDATGQVAPGVYFVVASSDNEIFERKILIR